MNRPVDMASLPAAIVSAIALLLALPLPSPAHAQSRPIQDLSTFPRTTLDIVSGSKKHRFEVWIADTAPRQEQGLMFVRQLPPEEGMLFLDCCNGIWMKNTYIELDIVFVGTDGRIAKIAARAQPFDETTIPAPGPVEAVVELKGGQAQALGLKVGDTVEWKEPVRPTP